MSDHSQIMNLQVDPEMIEAIGKANGAYYKLGHKDARHAAAEISLRADGEIARLRETLEMIGSAQSDDPLDFPAMARDGLNVNTAMEQSNE